MQLDTAGGAGSAGSPPGRGWPGPVAVEVVPTVVMTTVVMATILAALRCWNKPPQPGDL